MILKFNEVLNDLVNYFILGDIRLLMSFKEQAQLGDDLAFEFTHNTSGDDVFAKGIVIPMSGIENYPYTILFNVAKSHEDVSPILTKSEHRLQFRRGPYQIKVANNMLMLFTWRILSNFNHNNVEQLITSYQQDPLHKPLIKLSNGYYDVEILGGELFDNGYFEPTFEFFISEATTYSPTKTNSIDKLNLSFALNSSCYQPKSNSYLYPKQQG